MEKIKILLMSNMYPSRDKAYAGIFVKNQYEFLSKNYSEELDIDLLVMKRKVTGMAGSLFKYLNFFLKSIWIFFREYDAIHLHYYFPLGLIPFLYKKIHPRTKLIVTFHGSDIHEHVSKGISKKIFTKIINDFDILISVGNDLSLLVEENLGSQVDLVLSAGVDQSVFYQIEAREKKYDFIFVGSLIYRKGIDLLLNSIQELEKSIWYCIVGSGKYENEIKNLIQQGYCIDYYKEINQSEIRELLNKSKWFIFPSRNEPFGLVVTESLFCGTPAIVSKVGGLKEQVSEGFNGFFIDNLTVEKVKESIEKATLINESQYSKFVDFSTSSNKEFSLKNVCSELLKMYRK